MAYRIVGTHQQYSGKVIKIGDLLYTTAGGGIEGDRQQVEEAPVGTIDTTRNIATSPDSRDVVTQFTVGDNSSFGRNSYYYSDGTRVANGTPLHHHTVPPNGRASFMTQHMMDGNEEDIFLTPQNNATLRRARTRTRPNQLGSASPGSVRNLPGGDSSPNNPGGNVGGGNTGGGMGGGSSY
tara:strand:+ start:69 stop:611 length:543 start_codon:yes stop_codon:yes gene_type:complete